MNKQLTSMSEQVIYNDGELELEISVNSDNIWLRQNQISEIFQKDRSVITKHINNIFKDNEVDKKSNVQKMHIAFSDKPVNFYSLDIVLAVGYRTNSSQAIKFRQWATSVLKNYIQNGYAINREKITQQRLQLLENDMSTLKSHIKNNRLEIKQGIFFKGEIFDAHLFVSEIIKNAKNSVVLIDNYIDESILILLSKNQNINIIIYTQAISKQLKLDIEKYNKQYNHLQVKITKNFHDRFMIIDDNEVYHIGASLKDLGNKIFAFSKIDIDSIDIIKKL